MFSELMQKIQAALDRMSSDKKRDKFNKILLSDEMETAILKWTDMYNNEPPWIDKDEGVTTIGIAGDIASEFARLTTIELDSHITGGALADALEQDYQKFLKNIRIYTEYGCAKGGCVFKPYFNGKGISIDCVQADAFYPTAFDSSGKIIGAIFAEQIRRNNRIYTRVEWHEVTDKGYRVINNAYRSSTESSLGHPIPLSEVIEWENIEEDITLAGVDIPLFGYFKVPQANKIDNRSPLGVSVFSNAVDNIKYADEQYSRMLREFQLTEPAVMVGENMLKRDSNGNSMIPRGYERLYRTVQMNTGITESAFYQAWSPSIREQSLLNGLNSILQRIEFNCGLSYGTISDPNNVDKTATEIITSKQRLYSTVTDLQKSLKDALEDTVAACAVYAGLYNISSYSDYDISFNFDDSIVIDKTYEQAIRMQEVTAGILDPIQYLMYRYGVNEEQAKEMMPKQAEQDTDGINAFINNWKGINANT